MFELVVMPLIELWMDEGLDEKDVQEALEHLQHVLAQETGAEIDWEESLEAVHFEADGVNPYCLYGLRAAAAWLEEHEDLEEFEVTDEPWLHDAFDTLESRGHARTYRQVLHADGTYCVAYLPAMLDDVYIMEEEGSEEPPQFSVGSLAALRAELDTLREALGLEPGLEEHIDDVVFDPAEDALAGPRYGWLILSTRCNEAIEKALPMMLFEPEGEDVSFDFSDGPLD